jgi:hypothetical protein
MSQKERSYWECPIKLSTKPSKPKNRTWIFPKTKDEENWWHGYTKKKTNTRGNQILVQNLCPLQFLLVLWGLWVYVKVVWFANVEHIYVVLCVLWVYVKVVWFANVEHIYVVLCVLWVYVKVVWCASVWTYCSSEWSSMKNISFWKHSTIKQKQLSENIFSSFIGIYKNG